MDSFNVMVIGANSDLGLEFVRQLTLLPNPPGNIFATYSKEDSLKDLLDNVKQSTARSKVILIKMDNQILSDMEEAKKKIEQMIGKQSLNIIISTQCFNVQENRVISPEILEKQFHQYTLPPLMLLQIMLPLFKVKIQSTPDLNMKSIFLNIIEDNSFDCNPLFEVNKVALNLALDAIAESMQESDVLVFSKCINIEENSQDNDFSNREECVISILFNVLRNVWYIRSNN